MYNVKIISTGKYIPNNIVTNDDISKFVDTNDKWISERTGIKERRISTGENTSDMAIKAAIAALEKSSIKASDLDLIIVATCTPDSFVPSTACIVQDKLGASKATCFDVSAACTGFIYALGVASQFIKTGQVKNALVIGAETLSKMLNWEDRTTCILFADGAGAAIVERSEEVGLISQYTGSDGTGGKALKCDALPVRNPYCKVDDNFKDTLSMEGREVFKFAVNAMIESVNKVLENTEYNLQDIDYIVPHQANIRIIEFVSKKLKIPQDKFYVNLDKYGNTSGASIPIALDEMNKKGMFKKGDKIILVGFGGGLTFGAHLIQWN
ncbi:beta-ketoacyl-ACP synthase III [Clostridium botulinum]|uniref:Beta-ketoacyl-[acyl-carrier-protein] synthase III n=2 Tax=Clostridium botulinum TaxID=1491 RepID=A0A9Q1ZD48_CLOBO|nr:beta-ketoacyl-ACP synthase III [Clostridium botulinum]AEB74728.1 3-oxoacyl-[acyl-carrier-protein] synthase III (Beta-ketoacyl-ACP synthase III) (KAS III) [Clostridium botulinum BKT015925]KEI03111.1 3-oxoacyl-ACP synthase [Clostridium botulinum C/D str. Sp77]KLU74926.1 3-oxoacyl-ACP synthase [Clostridium botulinum V891]KOA75888.1 3-oxoacyl-ACP synthase [Clostridium botulinum]KOA80227.1 3-oxoacyl-ACP synthase [Clostridium botulinum]